MTRAEGRTAGDESGFSLLELLVSSLVMGLVLGGLYMLLDQTQAIHTSIEDHIADRQSARVALNQFADIARATGFELKAVDDPISIASLTEFRFAGDVDNNSPELPCGAAAEEMEGGGAERVTYTFSLDGTELTRTIECWGGDAWTAEGGSVGVAASGIVPDTGRFRYWDVEGNELDVEAANLAAEQRNEVRAVTLELAIRERQRADGEDAKPRIRRMRVQMRNVS